MIIKLNPGDRINLTIQKADVVEGNYGPQYKFAGTTPTDPDAVLFLNVDTAERQFARIGITPIAAAIGQTVEVEKVERDGKKFTNINKPSGVAHAPASTAKQPFSSGGRLPWENEVREASEVAPVNVSRLNGVLNLHDVCVDHAISVTAKKLTAAGIPYTASDILAAAATQMIGAQKVGAAA